MCGEFLLIADTRANSQLMLAKRRQWVMKPPLALRLVLTVRSGRRTAIQTHPSASFRTDPPRVTNHCRPPTAPLQPPKELAPPRAPACFPFKSATQCQVCRYAKLAQYCPNLPFCGKIHHRVILSGLQQEGDHMADHPDEILTIDEVAAYLKASRRTVYRLAAGGRSLLSNSVELGASVAAN